MTTSLSAAGGPASRSRPSLAPQEVAVPAGAESFLDLFGDVALGQVRGQPAGGRDTFGRGRAVRDHHRALQPEQRGAAIGFRIHAPRQVTYPAPLEQRA